MRLILNIVWLVFGGLWLALGYFVAGIICFILIITIPFGFAAFRIGMYALWPFGRTIVDKPGPRPGALIGNIIWVILFGIWLAIGHVITAVAMANGIPMIVMAIATADTTWPMASQMPHRISQITLPTAAPGRGPGLSTTV